MGYEWNDRLEADYTRYVDGKWFQGLNARDRAGYLKAREQWKRSRDVGNRFRDGMALLRGQTPERGYEKEVRHVTPSGPRVHDVANVRMQEGNEYKAGRVDKEKALPQLKKEEHLLKLGYQINWTVVQGARVDREVLDRFQELNKKWGRQFDVQEVTREQRRLALTIGKHVEKQRRAKEKEARALARAEKERQRKAQQQAVERAKVRAEQNRKMQQFREAAARGRADAPGRVERERKTLDVLKQVARERAASEAERDRVARESAERVLREFPFPVPSQSQERETVEIGERPTPELADAASVEREAADKALKQAREAAREQDAARNAAYERLQEQGRLTEVERLHWLGQGRDPHAAVREPPRHAPPVQGHGRDGQGVTRGQDRTR
ncbi:hypothetical protein ACQPW1_44735 [Nocardia sp. CA-128927]|uniref:hypothetical protein n=1 Tax=Nocardia sp. CA-128927 TaxID=3239975 RepID=UPI003D95F4E0